MSQRYFTLDEAQAVLPRVREMMEEIVELKSRADAKIGAWRDGTAPGSVELALARGQVEFLLGEVNARLERLCDLGCVPKDLDRGLVDFPTRVAGHGEAYYCWRVGEEDVAHWHPLTEGFSGRRPVQPSVPFPRRPT